MRVRKMLMLLSGIVMLGMTQTGDLHAVPDNLTLANDNSVYTFCKANNYELTKIEQKASGNEYAVSTLCEMVPMIYEKEGLSTDYRITEVEHGREHIRITAFQSGFKIESEFTLLEDHLLVHRGITILHDARGQSGPDSWSKLLSINVPGKFDRYSYDTGSRNYEYGFPLEKNEVIKLRGNWAWFSNNDDCLVVSFPNNYYDRPAIRKRGGVVTFAMLDYKHFRRMPLLKRGMNVSVSAAISLNKAKDGARAARRLTKKLVSHLSATRDRNRYNFHLRYLRERPYGHVLLKGKDFVIWETLNTEKVEQTQVPPAVEKQEITLALARNEYESVHLVVSAERDVESLSVRVSALKREEAVIPEENITVRYPVYVSLRKTSPGETTPSYRNRKCNVVYSIKNRNGIFAKDTFYKAVRYSDFPWFGDVEDPVLALPSISVEKGRNQPVWITVKAPANIPPGIYRGKIAVENGNKRIGEVPLEVKVWNFVLPQTTSFPTWYQFWDRVGEMKEYIYKSREWEKYYRNFSEHKISGLGVYPPRFFFDGEAISPRPHLTLKQDYTVDIDWSTFEEVYGTIKQTYGLKHFMLPYGKRGGGHSNVKRFLGLIENTPEFKTAYFDYISKARNYFQEKGWDKYFIAYIFDEPDAERLKVVKRNAELMKKAWPGLRLTSACSRIEKLIGVINTFCPVSEYIAHPATYFSVPEMEKGRERRYGYWWYNMHYDAIGYPIHTHRLNTWVAWKYKLDGYFVWCINDWRMNKHEPGAAMYIYRGKEGPVDSLRWEMTRDGLEEYDYLKAVEFIIRESSNPAVVRDGAQILDEVRDYMSYPIFVRGCDPEKLLELREKMGDFISRNYPKGNTLH